MKNFVYKFGKNINTHYICGKINESMKVSELKANPKNPRIIKDDKFAKLVQSIKDFPQMMEKRPIVCVTDVDGKLYPLGGNMRLKAIRELGYKEIPDTWIMLADDWTVEQRNEFVVKDNLAMGEWMWDELTDMFDVSDLENWGLDIPEDDIKKTKDIPEIGSVEFSDELLLEHNYIVLYFDNPLDWEVAQERFGLNNVKSKDSSDKTKKVGIGRVVNGKNFI